MKIRIHLLAPTLTNITLLLPGGAFGMCADVMDPNKDGDRLLARFESVTERAVAFAPKDANLRTTQFFDNHAELFLRENGKLLAAFEKRLAKFGKRVVSDAIGLFVAKSKVFNQALALTLAHGSLKDLVWQHGEVGRQRVKELGGDPEKLYNIFPLSVVDAALNTLSDAKIITSSTQAFTSELDYLTGHTFADMAKNDNLRQVYTDEIVASLRAALPKRRLDMARGGKTREVKIIDDLLAGLNLDSKHELNFRLLGRNLSNFTGGSCAGDCTAPKKENAWTSGAWMMTYENYELQVDFENKFFMRMVYMFGESEGALTAWVHAIEFSPVAREASTVSELADLRDFIFSDAVEYLTDYLAKGGVKRVYFTEISNSAGYSLVLKNLFTDPDAKYQIAPRVEQPFSLLNPLESAHGVNAAHGIHRNGIQIYLQGWNGPTRFVSGAPVSAISEPVATSNKIKVGPQQVERSELERMMHIINDEAQRFSHSTEIKLDKMFQAFDGLESKFSGIPGGDDTVFAPHDPKLPGVWDAVVRRGLDDTIDVKMVNQFDALDLMMGSIEELPSVTAVQTELRKAFDELLDAYEGAEDNEDEHAENKFAIEVINFQKALMKKLYPDDHNAVEEEATKSPQFKALIKARLQEAGLSESMTNYYVENLADVLRVYDEMTAEDLEDDFKPGVTTDRIKVYEVRRVR